MDEANTKGTWTFTRELQVAASTRPLSLVLGVTNSDVSVAVQGAGVSLERVPLAQRDGRGSAWTVHVPAHQQLVSFIATFTHGLEATVIASAMSLDPAPRRW